MKLKNNKVSLNFVLEQNSILKNGVEFWLITKLNRIAKKIKYIIITLYNVGCGRTRQKCSMTFNQSGL